MRVRRTGAMLHVCEECEATWDTLPTDHGWRDFHQRMQELGCVPEWSQVEEIAEPVNAEPDTAPNGGPAAPLENSNASGGPPSVS